MYFIEQLFSPFDQMESVDIVDILLAFIYLPLDPVAIEVPKQVVGVFGRRSVSVPLFYVEGK